MPVPTYLTAISSGLLVSLMGSLPLGNLNISVLNIAAQKGWRKAAAFSIGAASVEFFYLVLILQVVAWIIRHNSLFQSLQWIAVAVLLMLSISGFVAGSSDANHKRTPNIKGTEWAFGIALSATNPLQFPFWAGWIVSLSEQGYLLPDTSQSLVFAFASFAGTLTAFGLFIGIGRSLATWLQKHQRVVSFGIGFLFLAMAIWQVVTIFNKHT
jgi:threonine/homoserine/homoserine lactone efflux protein